MASRMNLRVGRMRSWHVVGSVASSTLLLAAGCHDDTSVVGCDPGELDVVEVHTRADIADLPRVDTIRELHVVDSELEDLSGFECLKRAENIYVERNPNLRSLEGLEGLTYVGLFDESIELQGGELSITGNPQLATLDGLDALERVEGFLRIRDNAGLVELEEFDALRLVEWSIEIADNPSLEAVRGFASYEGAERPRDEWGGGGLWVHDNPRLVEVALPRPIAVKGLNLAANAVLASVDVRVDTVVDYYVTDNPTLTRLPQLFALGAFVVVIANNDSLESLAALSRVEGIGYLELRENDALVELRGLERVATLDELIIDDNPALQSLAAIDSTRDGALATIYEELAIRDNVSLPTCEVEALAAMMLQADPSIDVEVAGNGGSCP